MKKKEKAQKSNVQDKKQELNVIKKKEKKFSNEIIKKWLSRTSYTIIILAIIIAAYIGLNLLVEKINISDIDLTKDKVYTLSETSKTIIKGVDQDVDIILVNLSEAQAIVDFVNKYHKENDKISVQEITDVNEYPELSKKYNLTSNTYEIIVESDNGYKIITTSELYTYDYTTGEEKDLTEEAITNALLNVTLKERPKIYFLAGHNENLTSYLYAFKQSLKDEANDVEELDLLIKGSVPEDCSALIITTLDEDIKELERDEIIKYIKQGGKIALFTDPNITKVSMPNFQKVLDEYGISISEGIMIEQDTSKMLAGSPSAIIVSVNQGTSVTQNLNMNVNACFINSGKIIFKDSETLEKLGVSVETLATTTEKAFYRSDLTITTTSKNSKDEEGAATVGALITKEIDENTISKLVVYANNIFITNMPITISNYYTYAYELYNNEDLALNSISSLTEREDTILIRKNTESSTYTVTTQQENIVLAIIFAVPVAVILVGIIVWQSRRRKK